MQQNKPPEGKSVPMINSFLNLCRVCPVPTDDKVNSEYKRNFTWHDGYQTTKVDVIRNAPSVPCTSEPSLPRKKKYPGQVARDHLLYDRGDEGGESSDSLDIGSQLGLASQEHDSRARSEERNHCKSRASPRSRSADSSISTRLKATQIPDEDSKTSSKMPADGNLASKEEKQPLVAESTNPRGNPGHPGPPEDGSVPKTTEYRSQFVAWPRPAPEGTRKSASMGLIAAAKKDVVDGDVPSGELWNAVPTEDYDDVALDAVKRGRIKKTEYKAKFRPFSAYTYVDGSWKKATRLIKDRACDDMDIYSSYSYPLVEGRFTDTESGSEAEQHAWYSEVVERLKKADQYKTRSHAGAPLYGSEHLPLEFLVRDRATILSPVSVASSSRTWKDDRPLKDRGRGAPVPVHHRKDKKDAADSPDHPKSREGSTKKKSQVEKTTVRPKSAEPVIPVKSEPPHKSPKKTRPKAPKDLPVKGHGDLSGRKKAFKQSTEKGSPIGMKPRAVRRPDAAAGGADDKVWLKPDSSKEPDAKEDEEKQQTLVNGFTAEDSGEKMVNGEDYSVQDKMNGEHTAVSMLKGPVKVPLTTVKSPEEVTGVRSPDPESWTVPLEIGKGLHWMDGKTPDGVQPKGPPILFSKRLKESSLVGKSQKDIVLCDPDSEATGETVDL